MSGYIDSCIARSTAKKTKNPIRLVLDDESARVLEVLLSKLSISDYKRRGFSIHEIKLMDATYLILREKRRKSNA